jgi:hypothetical protein
LPRWVCLPLNTPAFLDTLPYGGFSPVRLQGRNFKRGLPSMLVCHRPSCSLLSSQFPALCQGRWAYEHLRASGPLRSTPGALAPVRVILSRSINTYSAPSAPLAGTSRLRRLAAYTRCPRCAYSHMPRRPTTGSELSLMIFRNMSSSETTGNFSAVYFPVLHRKRWPSTPVNGFGIPVVLTLRF